MNRLLVLSLLVAGTVALGGPARATEFPCSQTDPVSDTSGFNDCAGRSVTVDSFGSYDLSISHSGTWDVDDWFTDFHVTFDPDLTNVTSLGGSFTNLTKNEGWSVATMLNPDGTGTIWFTADSFAERVDPGDQYQWSAYASFNFLSSGAVGVTIEYTKDVPEPALGVVLLGGLVSLALARRRAA